MSNRAQDAVTAIKQRLDNVMWPLGWTVTVLDGAPVTEPDGPYICIYDQTGQPTRRKYWGGVSGLYFPAQLTCVARTKEGLRDLVKLTRAAVLNWPPIAGSTPLVEDGSNPTLTTGTGNDLRITAPLTLHCHLPKEN